MGFWLSFVLGGGISSTRRTVFVSRIVVVGAGPSLEGYLKLARDSFFAKNLVFAEKRVSN